MAMSDACPEAPPEGSRSKLILVDQYGLLRSTSDDVRCIMMLAFGRQCRFPFSPEASKSDPMEAANPKL